MRLLSVCGVTLFKSSHVTIKQALEEAVLDNTCLEGVNLRKANLSGAQLDMAKMKGACLWGADLSGADMSDGDFSGADFRAAILKDTCLAESDMSEARFHGAYFCQTNFSQSDLSGATFSCPSLFNCDLSAAASLKDAVYSHHGEIDCDLSQVPIVIKGLPKPIVIMRRDLFIGQDHYPNTAEINAGAVILEDIQRHLSATIDRKICG